MEKVDSRATVTHTRAYERITARRKVDSRATVARAHGLRAGDGMEKVDYCATVARAPHRRQHLQQALSVAAIH